MAGRVISRKDSLHPEPIGREEVGIGYSCFPLDRGMPFVYDTRIPHSFKIVFEESLGFSVDWRVC